MGVEKNRQLSNPARKDTPPAATRKKPNNELQDVKAKLVSTIAELHGDVQRLEFSSIVRKCKVGNLLLALKSLSGHGFFESEFERLFGGALSFRQAQRYIHVARSVALAMPLLRERLIAARPELLEEKLSDEEVLNEMQTTELQLLLDQSRSSKKQLSHTSPSQEFTAAFFASLSKLFAHFDHVLSSDPLTLDPSYASEIRVGSNPLENLEASSSTVLAVADASKEACGWLRDLIEAHEKESLQALLIVPAQLLESIPELFQFPELLLGSTDIFINQKKAKVSRYLVVSMIPSDSYQSFLKAFSALGTVKLPANSKL